MRDPHLGVMRLPEEQWPTVGVLSSNLSRLDAFVTDFEAAVSLLEMCNYNTPRMDFLDPLRKLYIRWKFIAGRDGAMTIFRFNETKHAVHSLLKCLPTLFEHLDRQASKRAGRLFDEAFPDFARIRFSVAHAGLTHATPEIVAKHAADGLWIGAGVAGDEYHTTIDGKFLSYRLNRDTAASLAAVRDAVYASFQPVSEYSLLPPEDSP